MITEQKIQQAPLLIFIVYHQAKHTHIKIAPHLGITTS